MNDYYMFSLNNLYSKFSHIINDFLSHIQYIRGNKSETLTIKYISNDCVNYESSFRLDYDGSYRLIYSKFY